MTEADPSMTDLFGEESDAEDAAQSSQPDSATQPDAASQPDASDAALNSTQPAINERDLFGSDDEDDDADADADDGAADAADAADPYTRRGSAVLDLEQQLAQVDEDGSALDEEAREAEEAAANDAAKPAAEEKDEGSQQYRRDKALAKRKKSMSKAEDDDDNDSTSSQLNDDEPSHTSSTRKPKSHKSSSPSPTRPSAAPVTATGPPLSLLSSPAAPFAPAAALHLVRLPNVIGVQAAAFNADGYVEEAAADEAEEAVGQGRALLDGQRKKSKAVSLMVENVIRWREVKDDGEGGAVRRESNTRLVKWSDGTSSLLIGNECFDVVQSTADPHRNYVYFQHTAVQPSDPDDMSDSPSHSSRPRTRPLLRSVGAFTGHIKFKVTGIDSDSHRKLKDVLFETHTKKARIVIDYNDINPEKLREEEQKQARVDDRVRSREQARKRGGGGGGGGGRRSGGNRWASQDDDEGLADFMEEDDDDNDNPSEKARRRKGDYEANVSRLNRAKQGEARGGEDEEAGAAEADEEEHAEDEGGDLDEDEILGRKRAASTGDAGGEASESAAEGEVAAPTGGRSRAEEVDDDLVLHGASKRRRVLADEEESE